MEHFFEKYPEYKITTIPNEQVIQKYTELLPEDLIQFWKAYGFGTFMDGYLRFVNPDDYIDFLSESVNVYLEPTIVFATTALGDFYLWEKERIKIVNYRKGWSAVVGSKFGLFMEFRLTDKEFLYKKVDASVYWKAIKEINPPAFNECLGYEPMLALGGSEKIENLKCVKMNEHLAFIYQTIGEIE